MPGPATHWTDQTTEKTAYTRQTINKTLWDNEDDNPSSGNLLLQTGFGLLLQTGGNLQLQ